MAPAELQYSALNIIFLIHGEPEEHLLHDSMYDVRVH